MNNIFFYASYTIFLVCCLYISFKLLHIDKNKWEYSLVISKITRNYQKFRTANKPYFANILFNTIFDTCVNRKQTEISARKLKIGVDIFFSSKYKDCPTNLIDFFFLRDSKA